MHTYDVIATWRLQLSSVLKEGLSEVRERGVKDVLTVIAVFRIVLIYEWCHQVVSLYTAEGCHSSKLKHFRGLSQKRLWCSVSHLVVWLVRAAVLHLIIPVCCDCSSSGFLHGFRMWSYGYMRSNYEGI